jgi:hypothetical protein
LHSDLAAHFEGCPLDGFLPFAAPGPERFGADERMYEVVYGCQGRDAGWVAGVRTDYIDNPDDAPERHCYSLFSWVGRPCDGVIISGKRRPVILRMVRPAPRLQEVGP